MSLVQLMAEFRCCPAPGAAWQKDDALLFRALPLGLVNPAGVHERVGGGDARSRPGAGIERIEFIHAHLRLDAVHPESIHAKREKFFHHLAVIDVASLGVERVIVTKRLAGPIIVLGQQAVHRGEFLEMRDRGRKLRPDHEHEVDVEFLVEVLDHALRIGIAIFHELVRSPVRPILVRSGGLPIKVVLHEHIDREFPLAKLPRGIEDFLLAAEGVFAEPEAVGPSRQQGSRSRERAILRHGAVRRRTRHHVEIDQVASRGFPRDRVRLRAQLAPARIVPEECIPARRVNDRDVHLEVVVLEIDFRARLAKGITDHAAAEKTLVRRAVEGRTDHESIAPGVVGRAERPAFLREERLSIAVGEGE